ncbi:ATP-dependent DNA helicase PIF5-like [Phymastichus coffea]|uniref:ATP-dependent DNA helicase PIF5-like n=1 Tax=Phymastichus coffea TaxID=108790 RepID=UPI00273C5A3D|nr:ATP-dependent DNA helicase PIF5-like [Phymastichus coffea]
MEQLSEDSTDIFCDNLVDTYYPKRPIEKRKQARLVLHMKYNPQTQPEAYYFSILILFKPWRNTEELKGNQETYHNAFIEIKDDLSAALKYHDKLQMIQNAMDEANKLIKQQELEKTLTQKSEHLEIADPLDATEVIKDVQDLIEKVAETKDIDVDQSIKNLNVDQLRIFNTITSTMSSDNKVIRLFVSGFGGTGKSYLIENLVLWNKLKRNKNTAVAAPTGIAAFNIQGLTVHRLLQLPVEQGGTAKYKPLSDNALKRIRQSLKNVDFIIIDEISMISNVTLTYIHLRLTEIFCTSDKKDGWFGKIHIVVFGDLLQLPPVREEFAFISLTRSQIDKYIKGMLSFNLWTLFEYEELTINMRQKNDKGYSEILGKLRLGYLTNSDIETLLKRKISFSSNIPSKSFHELCQYLSNLPTNTVCLMPTKDMYSILNNTMLNKLECEEIKLIANDCYKCPKRLEKRVLKILNEDDDNVCGISRVITIKIGCKIMIRRNIDVSIGLVNGTIATVIAVTKGKTGIDSVTIRLQSNQEYSIKQLEYQFQILDQVFITRKQFPICLSYAITIHKSQGLSLENAVIDAGNSIFSCGQTYVALSRVTKLKGLHLINLDPSSIKADESAIK